MDGPALFQASCGCEVYAGKTFRKRELLWPGECDILNFVFSHGPSTVNSGCSAADLTLRYVMRVCLPHWPLFLIEKVKR